MTIQDMLVRAQEALSIGNSREAESQFADIYGDPRASLQQQYVALKGFCAALDARGEYHRAETEMINGQRALERKRAARERAHSREAQIQRTLLWGGIAIVGGTVLLNVLSAPARAA